MSERPSPPYASPSRGEEATPAEGCRVCGSPEVHTRAAAYPTVPCIVYLRAEIGTLQGEVLALRLQLAAKRKRRSSVSERPTIAELEKILDEPDLKVEMRPDGGIRSVSFRQALTALINRFSKENGSDTPDFILAEYLADCLTIFDKTTTARDRWYGHVGLSHRKTASAPEEPQTEAGAAVADAATWPGETASQGTLRTQQPPTTKPGEEA